MQILMVNGGTLHANSDHSNTLHREWESVMTYKEKKKKTEKRRDGEGKRRKGGSNPSKGNIFQ